jgi:hypothetical protein
MSNQFDAKIRFDPIAWRSYYQDTCATVLDKGGKNVTWWVIVRDGPRFEGTSTTPSGARAACRRTIEKYEREKKQQKKRRR